MDNKERGLYQKYRVERVDGKPVRQGFVLELKDPLTHRALAVWAQDLEEAGYERLADDINALLAEVVRD